MKIKVFQLTNIVIIFSLLFAGLFFEHVSISSAQSLSVWSDPVNLSNSGGTLDPVLVIDTRGVMHVIWADRFDGYKYAVSTDGVTWTSPKTVNYPFDPKDDSRPTLVANISGAIHVFWKDKNNGLYYSQTQPDNLSNPGSWIDSLKVADSVLDFNIVVDSRGTLHLSYAKTGNDVNLAGIYYRRLDGAGWSATKNLYTSQYFRSLNPENAHVRLAVSNDDAGSRRVYVVWDDRLQKRIFLAKSLDGGVNWDEYVQLRGPEDFTGSDLPFNVDISLAGDNVLLLWQAGEPGVRCVQYSQSSVDGGNQFAEPVKVLEEFVSCPKKSNFIGQNEEFSTVLLDIQDDLSLVVWNGSKWSNLQSQIELSVFSNPVTFENVLFECQNVSLVEKTLFVVGCDMGNGGDIWFRSRPLDSFEEWFPPPSAWTSPVVITSARQKLSSLVSVTDSKNNIHSFWVQSPLFDINQADSTIQYARWNDGKWSKPGSILAGFDGIPTQLSSTVDIQERLFLSWAEGKNGDLYFSWASMDRAHVPSEWSTPQQVPTPSQISGSPDILVDDSGRIVIAYSVPLNEGRGVYIVQSVDLGKTWSPPLRVFDAVSVTWDMVDQPQIGLSGDGNLHLVFSKVPLRESDISGGLYYSRSLDGGITWSQLDTVSEKSILWSQVLGFSNRMVHRLWQEDNGITLDTFHQISRDGGETWENSVKVSSVSDVLAKLSLTKDPAGQLYITQTYVKSGSLVVELFQWNDVRWVSQEKKVINVKNDNVQYSTVADVTHQGLLDVMISITYQELEDGLANEIISFTRFLELSGGNQLSPPLLIATPSISSAPASPGIETTPTVISPLANLADAPSSSRKNLIGLLLVGGVMILIVFVVWPRKKDPIG